jgi:hypothetical protein
MGELRQLLIPWITFVAVGILPVLGQSRRVCALLAALAALAPGWVVVSALFLSGDQKERAIGLVVAAWLAIPWLLGIAMAAYRQVGIAQGSPWARFPVAELIAALLLSAAHFYILVFFVYAE